MTLGKLLWRFFTGAHINGKKYNDATWWRRCSPRYLNRREQSTWWRRKCRVERMVWRHSVLWASLALSFSFFFYTSSSVIVLLALSPWLTWMAWRRLRFVFFFPVVAHGADGSVTQEWTLKPKYVRFRRKLWRIDGERKRPGLATRAELRQGRTTRLVDIPPEIANAIRHEVTELGDQPPIALKLLSMPGKKGGEAA